MLALLASTSAAENAAVQRRLDDRAASAGATIARLSIATAWPARLLSHRAPHRRAVAALPDRPKEPGPSRRELDRPKETGQRPTRTRPA